MPAPWCPVCCTRHAPEARCHGDLRATGPERPGFQVTVETPLGIEAYGVLLAPSFDVWRARILTYPKILWLTPGGNHSIKFVGRTPQEAEHQAIEFLRAHCRERGYLMRDELTEFVPGAELPRPPGGAELVLPRPTGPPSPRRVRFLRVRYGIERPTQVAGTGNLSETGLFVITDDPETAGRWLFLVLHVHDASLPLKGCVRWTRERYQMGRSPGMGIQLQQPPLSYLNYVRMLR